MKAKSWMAVALGVGLLLALPAGAAAGRHRGPSPQRFVAASILVHNAFANSVQDGFAGPSSDYAYELEYCHEVEAESGEAREDGEKSLREKGPNNIMLAEDLKSFNSRLPLWVKTFKGFESRLGRSARGKLAGAVDRLARAHTIHEHEFYDLRGVWVQIESVNCAEAEELKHQAEVVGSDAWAGEFRALVELTKLFKVKRPPVEYPVGPYVLEPSE